MDPGASKGRLPWSGVDGAALLCPATPTAVMVHRQADATTGSGALGNQPGGVCVPDTMRR
jgi:hypothetical protein